MKLQLRISQKPTPLIDCPCGLFVFGDDSIGFRSEYGDDAYCLESGEYFWGGTDDRSKRNALLVRPAYLHAASGPRPKGVRSE